jgi:hypothetical protein
MTIITAMVRTLPIKYGIKSNYSVGGSNYEHQ